MHHSMIPEPPDDLYYDMLGLDQVITVKKKVNFEINGSNVLMQNWRVLTLNLKNL